MYYKDIRNEVSHPKRKDQLISDYLDIVDPVDFINIVKYFLVKICEYQNKEYQYWMLGWNYIGCNHNDFELFLHSNGNGFSHSFNSLFGGGYLSLGYDFFSKKYLRSYESFLKVQNLLDVLPVNIEKTHAHFNPPKLTRRWWDKNIFAKTDYSVFPQDKQNKDCVLCWLILKKNIPMYLVKTEKEASSFTFTVKDGFSHIYGSYNLKTEQFMPIDI